MKIFSLLLLAGLAASSADAVTTAGEEFFEGHKIYTSKHDIVNIFVPLNGEAKITNASDSDLRALVERNDVVDKLFFVQGDYKDDGAFENKGLFVLNTATGEATKLLDNGVDFTSGHEERKKVYFAATDGIYLYNAEKNTAEKYGSVTDNIISIAQTKIEDVIYALTAENVLYKVTENGEKKEKVDDVKGAQQIVLDNRDNLYFYDSEKRIFVKRYSEPYAPLIQFTDLPKKPNKIKLLRWTIHNTDESVFGILDDRVVKIDAHNHNIVEDLFNQTIASATAHSIEGSIMFYFAHNKSIYEYNLLAYFTPYDHEHQNSVNGTDTFRSQQRCSEVLFVVHMHRKHNMMCVN